ncbi:MAG: hypothetical protein U5J96_04080 [Ignavibacteriaceae bacterium]|nr:hypothetical protein [Ignavibacteriaceae bacterium]
MNNLLIRFNNCNTMIGAVAFKVNANGTASTITGYYVKFYAIPPRGEKSSISIIFVFLFVQSSVLAQFNVCPTGIYNFGVAYACAVDDQVSWGSRLDATGVIVTTNGGDTWTQSNFTNPKAFSCLHSRV